jgi:lysophospholipase L1-like esterase
MGALTLPGRMRRVAGNLAVFIASLIFICIVLEVIIRLTAPQPLGLRYYSREGILLHYPGLTLRYARSEFASTVRINSDGLRDREYPSEKPPGTFRILVLGDSFTEGLQVDDEEVWPKLAERIIAERRVEGGVAVELVNAAIAGAGTADQIRYLQVFGARWSPDLVLLGFYCGNDVRDNLSDRRVRLDEGRLEIKRRKPYGAVRHRVKTARAWLGSHSHLYQFVRDRLDPAGAWKAILEAVHLREKKLTETEEWEEFDDKRVIHEEAPPEIVHGWDLTLALLDRMNQETAALGARFALVSIPSRWMVDRSFLMERIGRGEEGLSGLDPSIPGRRVGRWAAERNIPFADLYTAFLDRGVDRSYHYRTDAHWNPRGHRAAAEAISEFLLSSELLP